VIQFNDDSKAVLIMQCILWLLMLQINYSYLQSMYLFSWHATTWFDSFDTSFQALFALSSLQAMALSTMQKLSLCDTF